MDWRRPNLGFRSTRIQKQSEANLTTTCLREVIVPEVSHDLGPVITDMYLSA